MKAVILGDFENALRSIHATQWEMIERHCELSFISNLALNEEEIYQVAKDATIVVLVRDRIPFQKTLIDRLQPTLRLVIYTGERNATLDIAYLHANSVLVANTRSGPSKDTTAELTWSLILEATKHTSHNQNLVISGQWRNPNPMYLPILLKGQRLGLIGVGAIGKRVAIIGQAFGMEVVIWSPNMTTERAFQEVPNVQFVSLEELLRTSNIISLHLVLSPSTKHILNVSNISWMRTDSILVNTSRAELIDMTALLDSFITHHQPGQLALDVYDIEPLRLPSEEDHPLLKCYNHQLEEKSRMILSPHLGFVSMSVLQVFVEDIQEILSAYITNIGADGVSMTLPHQLIPSNSLVSPVLTVNSHKKMTMISDILTNGIDGGMAEEEDYK
jgi:phosphoglycerate dehydrogenase-like enzyme